MLMINKIKTKANTGKKKDKKNRSVILEKTGGLCWLCGKPINEWNEFSIDHKIPRSKGGCDLLFNKFPAHKYCNGLKGDKIINNSDEFMSMFKSKMSQL